MKFKEYLGEDKIRKQVIKHRNIPKKFTYKDQAKLDPEQEQKTILAKNDEEERLLSLVYSMLMRVPHAPLFYKAIIKELEQENTLQHPWRIPDDSPVMKKAFVIKTIEKAIRNISDKFGYDY